ncbi:annexin B11-like isoform X2 [Chironomus tepperi]|uniref:annexin B11-like isoform X1 n=1 Tax=Chironomus tepperi TaxID=113505 RepID=UPI00391F6ECF
MNPNWNPSLKPAENFDPYNDAEILQKAMKGAGTNSNTIINILCHRTDSQRIEIVTAFQQLFKKSLQDEIKSETSGNFQKVLIGLTTPIPEFYANEIQKILSSRSKKLDLIIDVTCLMTNEELNDISMTYQRLYKKSLAEHMREELSGHFENMLISLAEGKRIEDPQDEKNVYQVDARLLKEAINRIFKDEAKITEIFGFRSTEYLKLVSKEYMTIKGVSLEDDISTKFSGDFKDALLLRLNPENQYKHFAHRINKSMDGLGTDNSTLIRLCITRCELDMNDIKVEFQSRYSESLKSFIEGDTSGKYKKALLALCGEGSDNSE